MVHISFPRHMSMEKFSRRRAVMEQACKDLGLKFVYQSSPDPTSDVGVAGAQMYLLEKMPGWIKQYSGPDHDKVAFFCTNDAQTEPVIKRVLENPDAIFVEPSPASPIMGFPGALGLDLRTEAGNFPAIMKKTEKAVIAKGGSGRLGTWSYSTQFVFTAGLGELGKRVVEGKAKLSNKADILAAFRKYTPDAKWNSSYYTDRSTGIPSKNLVLLYMDTYIFGKGYMNTTGLKIADKYFALK
jgi:hypothetical protein